MFEDYETIQVYDGSGSKPRKPPKPREIKPGTFTIGCNRYTKEVLTNGDTAYHFDCEKGRIAGPIYKAMERKLNVAGSSVRTIQWPNRGYGGWGMKNDPQEALNLVNVVIVDVSHRKGALFVQIKGLA